MSKRTPLQNQDEVFDTIDHLHQDHPEELLFVAHAYTPYPEATKAQITDIFEEGLLLNVTPQEGEAPQECFIPFELKGGLEEQMLYTIYAARLKLGAGFGENKKQFFEVLKTEKVTQNFLRIDIKSLAPLPEEWPAHAYWFQLKTASKKPASGLVEKKSGFFGDLINRTLLFVMKQLSSKTREKVLKSMGSGGRYYTISHVWGEQGGEAPNCASFDVFLHGESPGSLWAKGLKKGDVVFSQAESISKHDHLTTGQTLLFADESGFAAMRGILSTWKNPIPPHVLLVAADPQDHTYFKKDDFPPNTSVEYLSAPTRQQGEKICQFLATVDTIDAAWGVLEVEESKHVRHYLRNERGLKGKNNRIKGYWQLETEK